MARKNVNGIGIDYELRGDPSAPVAALIPGGRYPKDTPGLPQLADRLAEGGRQVLLWDRPNCGDSDVSFTGETESTMNADALIGLIRALDLKDVAICGGSAGSRIALMAAARAPELVSKLIIWWISGEPVSLATLAFIYTADSCIAASRGGMEAVAKLPSWAEQIQRNPRNRDIILSQDVGTFIATMQRWAKGITYVEDSPVPGMTPDDFAKLTMPVWVFRSGQSDQSHPRVTSDWVHRMIPHSTYVDPPWPDSEWNDCSAIPNAPGRGRFERWPLLAPQLLDFMGR